MQAQAPVVIVTQPGGGSIPQTSNWQTGLCDCFSDCGVCLCGIFCFSCLAVQVASDLNECCLCGTSVAMRTLYRTRYGIPFLSLSVIILGILPSCCVVYTYNVKRGSICDDFMVTLCCPMCSLCQIKRDINRRRAMHTF